MSEKADDWRVPFEHAQLTTLLHSTAMTRMAVSGCEYGEAMTFALGAVRSAAGAAAALLEHQVLSDAEKLAHREGMDAIVFGAKGRAVAALGYESEKDL
ncbi:hypothetical protein [Bosea sp. TND4EK4]|uniref:hypothetical protein n=1 Tax=Bosea sp. TND4EK4 TaxID=1907408 RepID=UPI0009553E5C|nr:hypothetical protein [Bosea sp. TND4EK4]SIR48371.1 hypothetical protein SAMN05880592_12411 [Bosea sp. TND4EK4]